MGSVFSLWIDLIIDDTVTCRSLLVSNGQETSITRNDNGIVLNLAQFKPVAPPACWPDHRSSQTE